MKRNITPSSFPEMAGSNEAAKAKFVADVYSYANKRAQDAAGWYLERKTGKQQAAQALRFLAIILTTIGGVIPLLAASRILPLQTNMEYGQFGYVALALAGACVLLDKFFGYSSSWMRYITTAMKLQRLLEEFNLDWAMLASAVQSEFATATERESLLKRVQTFLHAVLAEVESETAAWAAEYRSNLAELEKSARQQLESNKPGVINLKVANASNFREGVTVLLDEVPRQTITSNECQLSPVFPGDHFVKVQAIGVNGNLVTAGAPLRIDAGQSVTVELSLPAS
jgi:hypothetical protein